jgi:hypothetical protein
MIEAIKDNLTLQFAGPREAARDLNLDHSAISKCIAGKRRSHGGFVWRVADPYFALEDFLKANCERSGDSDGKDWIQTSDLLARYAASQPLHVMTLDGLVDALRRDKSRWNVVETKRIRWLTWKQATAG